VSSSTISCIRTGRWNNIVVICLYTDVNRLIICGWIECIQKAFFVLLAIPIIGHIQLVIPHVLVALTLTIVADEEIGKAVAHIFIIVKGLNRHNKKPRDWWV
jgi:hypothetical protein